MKVSTIIPAYNEEGNLRELVERVEKVYLDHSLEGELVIVNDGSTDHTGKLLDELVMKHPLLKPVHHKRNMGLTQALITCFNNSSGDILVFLPADLESHPEEDIPKLLKEMNKGYDVVLGWRQNRKGGKIFASKVYNTLSNFLFGMHVHDLNWIKALRREVVNDIELRSDWHRYIPILAKSKGYKIGEVKVNVYTRKYGRSKYGLKRLFIGFMDLMVVKFHTTFTDKPMMFFSLLGLLFTLLGFLVGLYLVYIKIALGTIRNRIPQVVLVSVLLLAGIQFFAIGFLSELIVTLNNNLKRNK